MVHRKFLKDSAQVDEGCTGSQMEIHPSPRVCSAVATMNQANQD